MLREIFSRLIAMFRQRQMDRDFDDEAAVHLEMLAERFAARGMPPEEARLAARRQFGGMAQMKSDLREMRGLPAVEAMVRDFRHASRRLARAKGFTATAALTLALGIGAGTAVFTVLDAVVLRPLPFAEPDRLMAFRSVDARGIPHQLSYPEFFDYRKRNEVFEHLVSYRDAEFTLADADPPIQVPGEIVSSDLFPMLRVQPQLGRGFLPRDEEPGERSAVLSHSLWTTRFGGDPGIVGKPVRINGSLFTVVGVATPGFRFPVDAPGVQLWVCLSADFAARQERGARMLDAVGRLKPGVSRQTAQAQTDLIARSLAEQFPDNRERAQTMLLPEAERVAGPSLRPLIVLSGAVAMLLLIACANVANLLLARTAEQARDFALRTALGASRSAIVRQMLIEGFALALLGAAGGVLFALAILESMGPLMGESIPRIGAARIGGPVLAFSILLAVCASILFSLAPALQAAAAGVAGGLKEGAQSIAAGKSRFRSSLVVLQVTLGLVLLVGAELLAAGFVQAVRRDPGFRSGHLLTFNVGHSEQAEFGDRLIERLKALPGVQAAAMGRPLPLRGREIRIGFDIPGRAAAASERRRSDAAIVTPGFFEAMGIPLIRGRDIGDRDSATGPPVVAINQAFAQKFFPGEDALGKRVRTGSGPGAVVREVIGIAGNARQVASGVDFDPIIYFPSKQLPWGVGTVVLRTAGPPKLLEPAIRAAVAAVDGRVPIDQVRTGEQLASGVIARMRFVVALMGGFAAVALVLTVTGLYGLLSFTVERRRREIGLRIALGAGRRSVLGLVFGQAARLVGTGLLLGLAGAFVGARLLRSSMLEAGALDFAMLSLACGTLAAASLVAAYVPASRAASVEAVKALRSE